MGFLSCRVVGVVGRVSGNRFQVAFSAPRIAPIFLLPLFEYFPDIGRPNDGGRRTDPAGYRIRPVAVQQVTLLPGVTSFDPAWIIRR